MFDSRCDTILSGQYCGTFGVRELAPAFLSCPSLYESAQTSVFQAPSLSIVILCEGRISNYPRSAHEFVHRPWVEKPCSQNKIVLKSKELTSIALTCLTLRNFHEVSRAGGPK